MLSGNGQTRRHLLLLKRHVLVGETLHHFTARHTEMPLHCALSKHPDMKR